MYITERTILVMASLDFDCFSQRICLTLMAVAALSPPLP
jgi:hypothetical protein